MVRNPPVLDRQSDDPGRQTVPRRDVSILIVDDEEQVRNLLSNSLSNKYLCMTAASAEEARQILSINPVNLVLADIHMPGGSGIALCETISRTCPDTVVVMVSGETQIKYAVEAMRQGAFDYITKPFDLPHVLMSVDRALTHQALIASQHLEDKLTDEIVRVRTGELRSLNRDLNELLEDMYANFAAALRAMAGALETRDTQGAGHSARVAAYSIRMGGHLGLKDMELLALDQGALLHDVGKVRVRDSIQLKPGSLAEDEWIEMRQHVGHGLQIIEGIELLSGARLAVAQHHEKYDGTGYPEGLRGESINFNARIVAVADAFDAMTSDGPYRAAVSYKQARNELVEHAGSQFDPVIVEAFMGIDEGEWALIREEAANYPNQVVDEAGSPFLHSFDKRPA
jgi:putative two-component system response regulator